MLEKDDMTLAAGRTVALLAAGMILSVLAPEAGWAQQATRTEFDIAPVSRLLERVHTAFRGRVLTVELDAGKAGSPEPAIYKVKLLTNAGNVLNLYYDARTLRLERIQGRQTRDSEGREGGVRRDGGNDRDDLGGDDDGGDGNDSDDD